MSKEPMLPLLAAAPDLYWPLSGLALIPMLSGPVLILLLPSPSLDGLLAVWWL